MKMNKKITAMILSAVIAAAPVAAPVMEVQTVAAATTTTKTLKNTWSKDGRILNYDQNGRKATGVENWQIYVCFCKKRQTGDKQTVLQIQFQNLL